MCAHCQHKKDWQYQNTTSLNEKYNVSGYDISVQKQTT